jgi:DNA-directed RNA polymerase subunit RPC12/RpoP
MDKNPASCPGLSQFMRPTPSYLKCPNCQSDVEIWSDEEKTSCPNCGTTVSKDKLQTCLEYCEYASRCKELISLKKRERNEL